MTVIHWQFWRLDKELEFSSVAATVAVPLYGSPVPGSWSLARSRLVPSKRFFPSPNNACPTSRKAKTKTQSIFTFVSISE
ncbi:hypothetical protein BFJ70_g10562 [Fusarium oxysporum]|uniref:Uncharacterized protein n=2 Tax=Fusarium oxysporum TaxID=5507 RepID=A0A420S5L1_FUSOX|nr:hypothetical protein BFJ65_g12149 [Fusarium oxysporum f. sp. cepae]RKK40230.1 hypothetical protein BFJ67_g11082 [Fusarium oxysporum f. sp. cepae]RKK42422.1 hypothetical protein BFJ66_g10487 [Fusarium oxysporum f. sp. cepae]RKL24525.1 hypothetical protein BFJ68_g528 [Fusarium oxysporum]RKL29566.1 hypothetical protein BFJ70_g10562 [Fusarium oxysporum]